MPAICGRKAKANSVGNGDLVIVWGRENGGEFPPDTKYGTVDWRDGENYELQKFIKISKLRKRPKLKNKKCEI